MEWGRRLKKVFSLLGLILLLTAGLWEDVCRLHGVNPKHLIKPQVVKKYDRRPNGVCYGFYCYPTNTIYVYDPDPRVLAHEYAHAVMFSFAYQEKLAERTEKILFGSVKE
jgi:hypothetical protein